MACLPATYWSDRLEIVMALIVAYDAAILALSSGVLSYHLNTGQTTQIVSKQQISSLRATRDGLLNELATLEARVCGAGAHLTPTW